MAALTICLLTHSHCQAWSWFADGSTSELHTIGWPTGCLINCQNNFNAIGNCSAAYRVAKQQRAQ